MQEENSQEFYMEKARELIASRPEVIDGIITLAPACEKALRWIMHSYVIELELERFVSKENLRLQKINLIEKQIKMAEEMREEFRRVLMH